MHVRVEEEGVANCCFVLVDPSHIVRGSGDSRCRPVD
jgi:hypothetical protein